MTKQEDFRGKRQLSNYFCMSYLQVSKSCSSHKIKTSNLETAVLEAIQVQVKLVIELDGGQHNLADNIDYDIKRSQYIRQRCFKIIRFGNKEIDENIEGVVDKIIDELNN